ncbi:saccharopine dehydrogenase [bacterium]|nr:saccharopine dehydrogenase [bacterium]
MKKVIVFGAGLSATYLIHYLEQNASALEIELHVVDLNEDLLNEKCSSDKTMKHVQSIKNVEFVQDLVKGAALVVSLLPASLHLQIAQICLKTGVHLATASYLSEEMKALNLQVEEENLIFLNECGLDPGIDHMSAMKLLNEIRAEGGKILEFESFTGGLVAPDCEDNPWRYKFTWNPRNVVLAAQGGAVRFIHNGNYKYIPYHRVFRRTEIVEIEGYGKFEGYANRDSLKYRETYGLEDVQTMYRGTFRRPGFSRAWNCFVMLGATDDSYEMEQSEIMSYRDFINSFLPYHPSDSVELKLRQYLNIFQDDVDLWEKLEYFDIFSHKKIGLKNASPAQILQKILQEKWSLSDDDRDMIVMWHKVVYELKGEKKCKESSLVTEGKDRSETAMARTVGTPLGIACKLILQGKIDQRGCILPITEDFYQPILAELESWDINFKEKELSI